MIYYHMCVQKMEKLQQIINTQKAERQNLLKTSTGDTRHQKVLFSNSLFLFLSSVLSFSLFCVVFNKCVSAVGPRSLQDAGIAPGTTVTSAGKTQRLSASSARTPSARLTRRGRCAPGPRRDSCAARSTTSWRERTTRFRVTPLRQK